MERTRQIRKPDLLLTSDWHLREDTPTCWIGDFQSEQWDSVNFVSGLQKRWNIPVICAGDIFHHWKPSPWLLTMAMEYLPAKFFSCAGQHDMPQHNIDLIEKSGYFTLMKAEVIKTIDDWDLISHNPSRSIDIQFCHYGQSPKDMGKRNKNILVWHHMTYINPPFPGATGGNAVSILKKYPQFDLIVTGDNHQSFYTEYEGRLLVNPGNLTRQTADQADFQPRIALWYADTNSIEWVNIPIQKNAITREHIEVKEQRDARIDAFISKLDGDWVAGMSFEENLEAFFAKNETRDPVKQIIYKVIA